MRLVRWCIPICLLMFLVSCASSKNSLREHKGSYLESVKLNFEAGEAALKASDYDKAISYFQFVRSKYPFSQYAALSDLKIADAKFAQKRWLDAASAYEVFIRLHPRHEEVAYASYRVGASYFYAIPDDFFLLPKSTDRDQSFTKEALSAIERFILQFPDSEHIKDAKEKRQQLFSKLALHNMQVAGYYLKRGRFQAAVNRYVSVESMYPESAESAEALFIAADILRTKLHDTEQAIELYAHIVNEKKDSPYVEQASIHLGKLLKGRE
jgi:outer membrane protein assembly factor BamD